MERPNLALEYFEQGYNCAQSVVLAYVDLLGGDKEMHVKCISGFGGGMGRMREVCGAVSGMNYVLSSFYGYVEHDDEKKTKLYSIIQKAMKKFEQNNSSYICGILLNGQQKPQDPTPEKRTAEYYQTRPCGELVKNACEILEEILCDVIDV